MVLRDAYRHNSLDLYGITAAYRRDDGLVAAYLEIVGLARTVAGMDDASIDLYTAGRTTNLAHTGSADEPMAALGQQLLPVGGGAEPVAVLDLEQLDTLRPVTWSAQGWVGVPLVGREGETLGMLTAWSAEKREVDPTARLLLKHLGAATVNVLDRQRRLWEQRGRPGVTPLRSIDRRARHDDR